MEINANRCSVDIQSGNEPTLILPSLGEGFSMYTNCVIGDSNLQLDIALKL